MHGDVVLPAFELDCRDWLVATPDAGLPDEVDGSPLLAVLSTALFDTERFCSTSGVLTVGVLDEADPPALRRRMGQIAAEMIEPDCDADGVRYLAATPDGRLAVVADFTISRPIDDQLRDRIDALMTSFRWAA